jgi:hypothetical protein
MMRWCCKEYEYGRSASKPGDELAVSVKQPMPLQLDYSDE